MSQTEPAYAARSGWRAFGQKEGERVERPEDLIPAHLMKLLMDLKPVLEHQGSVQVHIGQVPTFRLRVRVKDPSEDRARYRRIPLGHDVMMARAVDQVITQFRKGYWERWAQQSRARVFRTEHEKNMTDFRAHCASFGHSRRQKRDIGREFDKIRDDPRKVFSFCFFAPVAYAPRRPGRPLKNRSW